MCLPENRQYRLLIIRLTYDSHLTGKRQTFNSFPFRGAKPQQGSDLNRFKGLIGQIYEIHLTVPDDRGVFHEVAQKFFWCRQKTKREVPICEALIGFCSGFPPGEIKDVGTLCTVQFSPHFLQQCPLEDASPPRKYYLCIYAQA